MIGSSFTTSKSRSGAKAGEGGETNEGRKGGKQGGVMGMVKRLYYGEEGGEGWRERRAEESRDRVERGYGVWEGVVEDIEEAFAGKEDSDKGEEGK